MKISLEENIDQFQEEPFIWKRNLWMVVRPIVVITTISKKGISNAALISNFMNVSVLQKLAFSCHPSHDTYHNILETKEFVVNVPSEEIIEQIMVTGVNFPPEVNELEKAKLTALPSVKINPPRIQECKVHFECKLDWYRDTIIVGKVLDTSVNEELIHCSVKERQEQLQQIFLAGARMYGKIGEIQKLPLEILRKYQKELSTE